MMIKMISNSNAATKKPTRIPTINGNLSISLFSVVIWIVVDEEFGVPEDIAVIITTGVSLDETVNDGTSVDEFISESDIIFDPLSMLLVEVTIGDIPEVVRVLSVVSVDKLINMLLLSGGVLSKGVEVTAAVVVVIDVTCFSVINKYCIQIIFLKLQLTLEIKHGPNKW